MQHVQDQYFEFCDWLDVPHEPVEWGLGPWAAEREWQREFYAKLDRPAAPIVVATSKPDKDWMPERWAEVCDALMPTSACSRCSWAAGRRARSTRSG